MPSLVTNGWTILKTSSRQSPDTWTDTQTEILCLQYPPPPPPTLLNFLQGYQYSLQFEIFGAAVTVPMSLKLEMVWMGKAQVVYYNVRNQVAYLPCSIYYIYIHYKYTHTHTDTIVSLPNIKTHHFYICSSPCVCCSITLVCFTIHAVGNCTLISWMSATWHSRQYMQKQNNNGTSLMWSPKAETQAPQYNTMATEFQKGQ